jgi:geranylgeranyl diphosphate synthase, type I
MTALGDKLVRSVDAVVDVHAVLGSVRRQTMPPLRAAVERLPAHIRGTVGYHFGWYDAAGRPDSAPAGKLLRPALTLLSARAVGGPDGSAVDVAVAIELVHNFSLLHDDVIDGDTTRRHRPTVWAVYGVPAAVLAGDALLALAVEVVADSPRSVSMLCTALRELVDGQARDVVFERRDDVTVEETVAMAGGKTAALLRCACEAGAIEGGGRPEQVAALRRFGWHLGIAFQLVDDLLGIWGDPAVTGKPAGSDLRARKKSLPVVAALRAGGESATRLAELYRQAAPLAEPQLAAAAALVEQAGGRVWATSEADRHAAAALAALAEAGPDPETHRQLAALAGLVTRREA